MKVPGAGNIGIPEWLNRGIDAGYEDDCMSDFLTIVHLEFYKMSVFINNIIVSHSGDLRNNLGTSTGVHIAACLSWNI